MIDVKDAIRVARDKLVEFYDGYQSFQDILLEEVELSEDERYWHVTLGFSVPMAEPTSKLGELLDSGPSQLAKVPKYERKYKLFRIAADDGTVRAMKIREP